jgi:excisionase family DNA binding protein
MSKEQLFAALAVTNDKAILAKVARVLKREDGTDGRKTEAETRLITQTEAAKRLGISTTTVWRLIREGSLKVVSVRGKQRVQLESLLAYVGVK